jgi:eukaryotic-like serine/threonine-protein kinase
VTTSDPDRDPLERLADEFVGRLRRGERPDPQEYADRHPDLAERIRALFPTLVLMEQIAPDVPPDVPPRLGEYRLVRELGRGGMGVVYEAVQESLGRRVAVKVLPAERCRGKWLERFQREARAAARLHHANIVPVFGVGQDGASHFYVMQYVAGHGLDRVLAEVRRLRATPSTPLPPSGPSALAQSLLTGRLAPDAAPVHDPAGDVTVPVLPAGDAYYRAVAQLGRQAAEALQHAHGQGLLHRDVKPSNLLLDERGTLWVADFGLAKAVGPEADPADPGRLTDTGDLVGTLQYMAPERFRGTCDARSDVYALGATLYELLALAPAFDAPDRLGLMERITQGDPAPLRRADPNVPRDLDTVVRKAMARRPEDRYPSAAELAHDLTRFLEGRPVLARGLTPLGLAWRWARRRPAVASLSAAVVLLLLFSAVGGWWAADRLRRQLAEIWEVRLATIDRLWEARLAEARAVRVSRLPGQRLRGLEAVAEAARIRPALALRNEAVACLALYDVRTAREWDERLETNRLEYSTGVAFDPALEHYAATDAAGAVTVRDRDGRLLTGLPAVGGPADYLRFSPDGRYLAARYNADGRPLRVWDWRAGRAVLSLDSTKPYGLSFDFHPGGEEVAVGADRRIDAYALPGGQRRRSLRLDFDPGWLAFEPGRGDRLAVCGGGEPAALRLDVLAWADGRTLGRGPEPPAALYAAAWKPGGGLLAASAQDGNVYLFDPNAAEPRPAMRGPQSERMDGGWGKQSWPSPRVTLRGHQLEARELAFTPDGSVLVTRGWDATTRFWDPVEGRELFHVRGASFLQIGRDGRQIAYRGYNSTRLGVWDLVGGDVCRVFSAPDAPSPRVHAGASFSPDGAVLATTGPTGVCLWDVATGRLLDRLPVEQATDVRFDPRGRWLFAVGQMAFRYDLRRGPSGAWQVGPYTVWPPDCRRPFQLAGDPEGKLLAVVDRFQLVSLARPGGEEPPVRLVAYDNVSFVAVSPDGELVATGPQRGSTVRVWQARDGQLLKRLPAGETAGVSFSPDGRRLLVLEAEGGCRCYAVDGWQLVSERHDPGVGFTRGYRVAFHPDGRTMAEVFDRVSVRLTDLDSGEERAVLPVPESHNLAAYAFSPDGRWLAAVTVRGGIQLWDLDLLHAQLQELGLDWLPEPAVPPADR